MIAAVSTADWQFLAELVGRMQAGDQGAYDEFALTLARILPPWFHRRRGFSWDDAKELTAQCIDRACEHIDQFKPREKGGIQSWVFAIARHVAADLRASYRDAPGPLDDVPEAKLGQTDAALKELIDGAPEAEREADPSRLLAIQEALGRLSALQQEVIHLRYFEDDRADDERTFASIAKRLGRPEGTVRPEHGRALAKLRKLLDGDPRIKLRTPGQRTDSDEGGCHVGISN